MNIYKVYQTVSELSISGWVSLLVIISLFIEVTPIKLNPIQWLGNRINKSMFDKVLNIERKVDQHIAEGYRNTILSFQDKLLSGKTLYTIEEWAKIIDTCTAYDRFCSENKIPNEVVTLAIKFIKQEYESALSNHNFKGVPLKEQKGG